MLDFQETEDKGWQDFPEDHMPFPLLSSISLHQNPWIETTMGGIHNARNHLQWSISLMAII